MPPKSEAQRMDRQCTSAQKLEKALAAVNSEQFWRDFVLNSLTYFHINLGISIFQQNENIFHAPARHLVKMVIFKHYICN